MKNILFPLILLSTVLFTHCDRGSTYDPPDFKEVLLQGPWNSTKTLEDWDLFGDYVEYGDSCKKDDPWYFNADGTFERQYGAVLCDSAYLLDEIIGKGTWELQGNNDVLFLKTPRYNLVYEVYYYDETELELRQRTGFQAFTFRPLKLVLQR